MTPYVPVLYTYPRVSRHPGRQRWFMFLPDGSTIGPAIRPETLTARLDAERRRAERHGGFDRDSAHDTHGGDSE